MREGLPGDGRSTAVFRRDRWRDGEDTCAGGNDGEGAHRGTTRRDIYALAGGRSHGSPGRELVIDPRLDGFKRATATLLLRGEYRRSVPGFFAEHVRGCHGGAGKEKGGVVRARQPGWEGHLARAPRNHCSMARARGWRRCCGSVRAS